MTIYSNKIFHGDCLKELKKIPNKTFDLVFADPPYKLKNLASIPGNVRDAGLLSEDGILVLEHGESNNFHGEEGFVEMRKYGHVHFSFFTFES